MYNKKEIRKMAIDFLDFKLDLMGLFDDIYTSTTFINLDMRVFNFHWEVFEGGLYLVDDRVEQLSDKVPENFFYKVCNLLRYKNRVKLEELHNLKMYNDCYVLLSKVCDDNYRLSIFHTITNNVQEVLDNYYQI